MNTFLEQVAKDIYNRFNGNFENTTIVFPNKRASLFFNEALCKFTNSPIWSPRYQTISELFLQMNDKVIADDIILIYYLFKAFKQQTESVELTFDKFYGWGGVLLNDFQDIDNNIVDAYSLFANVSDLEDLTNLDYLSEEQIAAIKKFFIEFDKNTNTELHKRFQKVWRKMYNIYSEFRGSLAKDGYAYEAMIKREVAEKISTCPTELNHLFSQRFIIVGFNVLNKTEKILFKLLSQNGALFYWDYDSEYIHDEAVLFIEQNIKLFPNALPRIDSATVSDTSNKIINIISSTTDTAQATYAGKWLSNTLQKDESLNETAVILCDENLLQPVLHSIPKTYSNGEEDTLLNITMGYPFNQTPIANFIISLLDLYEKGETNNGRWRYKYIENILKHPYVRRQCGTTIEKLLNTLKEKNISYPSANMFAEDDFLRLICSHADASEILPRLSEVITLISHTFTAIDSPLDRESLYTAYTVINRLINIKMGNELTNKTFLSHLIRQLFDQEKIAFHGEPAIGVQVLGVLETRNLDFKNIILLSTNDGMLPKIAHGSSFIPYTLRKAHDMTTLEKQASLYSYYFYRLLQRAENIHLVYNNYTEGLHKGEPSRFLLQLKYESNITVIEQSIESSCGIIKDSVLKINKTPELISTFPKRLSPTALNNYIECPLRFYLQNVVKLSEDEEVSDEVDKRLFGNIFHKAMYLLYKPIVGQSINTDDCLTLANDTELINKTIDQAFASEYFKIDKDKVLSYTPDYNGEQLLNKFVLQRYIKAQLLYDAKYCPMRILKQEDVQYKTIDGIQVGGIIDRIDEVTINGQKQMRVVDYKTSTRIKTTKSINDLFIPSEKRAGYIFQILVYCQIK